MKRLLLLTLPLMIAAPSFGGTCPSARQIFLETFGKGAFQRITRVADLPSAVRELYSSKEGTAAMADAGQPFAAGCVGGPGQPHMRLITGGFKQPYSFVFFESGGIALFDQLKVYELSNNKAIEIWSYTARPMPKGPSWEELINQLNKENPRSR